MDGQRRSGHPNSPQIAWAMKQYIEYLIRPLLANQGDLEVEILGSVANIKVAQEDMGRVIGKHGTIISAIRNLTKTFAMLHQLPPVSVNLLERV